MAVGLADLFTEQGSDLQSAAVHQRDAGHSGLSAQD